MDAIYKSDGHPTVDHFAQSFIDFKNQNRHLWFIPVRNAFHKYEQGPGVARLRRLGQHAELIDGHGHIANGHHQRLQSATGSAGDAGRGVVHPPRRQLRLLPRCRLLNGGSRGSLIRCQRYCRVRGRCRHQIPAAGERRRAQTGHRRSARPCRRVIVLRSIPRTILRQLTRERCSRTRWRPSRQPSRYWHFPRATRCAR